MGSRLPQRVKVRKENLPKPVKILSDLWLGSVHSDQCQGAAALWLNPSLLPLRAGGTGVSIRAGGNPMNPS